MKHFTIVAASTVLILFSAGCSQTDQDRARAEAERAKERTKQEARRLADRTKQAASEISDKTKSAMDDSGTAAGSAEAKLRKGAGDLQEAGKNATANMKEAAITMKVKSRIASDAGLSSVADVSVETVGHTVTLTGKIASEEKRREVEKAALAVDGVTKVNNQLIVR